MCGFVLMHRSMIKWEWWDDHNTTRLYMYCIFRANFKASKWRGQDIERGQFITSLDTLRDETGLTVSQIRTSLGKLISTGNLASKSQARSRIITVIDYDRYQANDKELSKQIAGKSQANRKLIATDKQCNNDNNGNNDKDLPAPLAQEKTKGKHALSPDFVVTDSMMEWANKNGYVHLVKYETEKFIDYWIGHGKQMKDWTRTWQNWIRTANERLVKQGKAKVHPMANENFKAKDYGKTGDRF